MGLRLYASDGADTGDLSIMSGGTDEITEGGAVEKINPAAARMLGSASAGDDLQELFPLLHRLAPQIVAAIESDP